MTGFGYGVLGFGAHTSRGDNTPNAFSFTDVTNQALNTAITSNTLTIAGMDDGTAISISSSGTGGTHLYQINSGSFTASAGTVNAGDTVTLKVTTAALYLRSTTLVSITIGSVTDVWSVITTAPAPAFASPTLGVGLYGQFASTGGSPSMTVVGENRNTGSSSAILAVSGAATNYLVAAGTTVNYVVPPATPMMVQISGTMTNHLYHPAEYRTTLALTASVDAGLTAGTGNHNALATATLVTAVDGRDAGPEVHKSIGSWDGSNSGITSNSQAITINILPAADPSFVSVLTVPQSCEHAFFHSGHPAATSAGAAGSTANYCIIKLHIDLNVSTLAGASIHNVAILDNCLVNWLPA
jgi:hypothetical protein